MGRKIAAFFTALNRALFIRLSCVSSSLSARRLLERRARTRTYAVYNYWQFFENDSNPCVKEKFVKAMKILIRHGPTDACHADVAFIVFMCRDNSRDFPRVVIFHAVSPSVILFLCSEKEFREWVELSTIFHSALFAWKEIWLGERRGKGRWKLGRNLEEYSFDYIEWDILESEIMLIRC